MSYTLKGWSECGWHHTAQPGRSGLTPHKTQAQTPSVKLSQLVDGRDWYQQHNDGVTSWWTPHVSVTIKKLNYSAYKLDKLPRPMPVSIRSSCHPRRRTDASTTSPRRARPPVAGTVNMINVFDETMKTYTGTQVHLLTHTPCCSAAHLPYPAHAEEGKKKKRVKEKNGTFWYRNDSFFFFNMNFIFHAICSFVSFWSPK